MTGDPVIRRTGSDGSIERTGADRQQVMQELAYLSDFYFMYLWWRIQHICQISALCICDERSSVFVRFLFYVIVMKDSAYLSVFCFMYLWWRIQPICQISPCTINVHICDKGSFIFVRTLDVAIYICVFVKTLLAEMCNAGSCVFFQTLWQILSLTYLS